MPIFEVQPECKPMGMEVSQRTIPMLEKLTRERNQVQQKLNELEDAIKLLEEHPEFQALLDTLGKVINRF